MTLALQPRIQGRLDFQSIRVSRDSIFLSSVSIALDEIDAYLAVLAVTLKQEAAKLSPASSTSPKEQP